jgi:phosphopantetheinyl transferase
MSSSEEEIASLIVYFSEEVFWERISRFESKNAQKMLKCSRNLLCFLLKFARKMLERYSPNLSLVGVVGGWS